MDYVADPLEQDGMSSWEGIEGLIAKGAEEKFGPGTSEFLRQAFEQQKYMRPELLRRYGLKSENNSYRGT